MSLDRPYDGVRIIHPAQVKSTVNIMGVPVVEHADALLSDILYYSPERIAPLRQSGAIEH